MKKSILLLAFMFFAKFVFAEGNAFEAPTLKNEFKDLSEIENAAIKNQMTLEELKKENVELFKEVNLNTTTAIATARGGDLPLNIPAIVWGFCCCIVGVGLVYFTTDNDKEQVKKAAIGCAIGAVAWFGLSLISGGFSSGSYYGW
jgi:archaellum component FlaF (FlaF/FlaG flagellin family)